MQAPVRRWNRCAANIERLPAKRWRGLAGVDHDVLDTEQFHFPVLVRRVQQRFWIPGIEYRIYEVLVDPVMAHAAEPRYFHAVRIAGVPRLFGLLGGMKPRYCCLQFM